MMRDMGADNVRRDAAEDEGYWEALLAQGEVAAPSSPVGPQPPDNGGTGDSTTAHHDWQTAQTAFEQGNTLTLTVVGHNRGGLLVQMGALRGFVPASHLLSLPRLPDAESRTRSLAACIGNVLRLKVIEIDRERGRLILSERAAAERTPLDVLRSLSPGDTVRGYVTTLRPFGAFVDLGGIEGLVHVSELAWTRINHPADVLRVGQAVEVYVISVAAAERKVALSLKRLQPDPWQQVSARYQVGQIVTGVITNVVSFGAFVRLDEGVEGLVHISELAEGHFLHPHNVVQEGELVQARILNMDAAHHRLALSLRQLHSARQAAAEAPGVALPPPERSRVPSA